MKIHEYQGKEILRKFGVPTPHGIACFSVEEAVRAAQDLGGSVWVVKAQIHAGGRGKGGGVKVAKSIEEVREHASKLLGMQLKTHQTGPEGQKVRRLLVEEGVDIRQELYVGMVVDRSTQRVCLMASSEGGMDIEEVADKHPDKIHKVYIDPVLGLRDSEADDICRKIGVPEASVPQGREVLKGLYRAFDECDASLAEINPLVITGSGQVIALDAKFNFDSNALFRHPEIAALRDLDEEDPAEIEASKYDLAYISLDGDIGCLVNGAGLAMATMDTIKLYGGSPANFLDVGGGATTEKVTEAFKIMLKNPNLKAILVNIFGGIMKCDTIANGIVTAAREVKLQVPLVVRMKGTNEELGKQILRDSGLPIISADNMGEAAERVVKAAKDYVAQQEPAKRAVALEAERPPTHSPPGSNAIAGERERPKHGDEWYHPRSDGGQPRSPFRTLIPLILGALISVGIGAWAIKNFLLSDRPGTYTGTSAKTPVAGPGSSASMSSASMSSTSMGGLSLGNWSVGSDGVIATLAGTFKDAKTRDVALASLRKTFGPDKVVDRSSIDIGVTGVEFDERKWDELTAWVREHPGMTLTAAGSSVRAEGEAPSASLKADLVSKVRAIFPGVDVKDGTTLASVAAGTAVAAAGAGPTVGTTSVSAAPPVAPAPAVSAAPTSVPASPPVTKVPKGAKVPEVAQLVPAAPTPSPAPVPTVPKPGVKAKPVPAPKVTEPPKSAETAASNPPAARTPEARKVATAAAKRGSRKLNVLFSMNSTEIRPRHTKDLDEFAEYLKSTGAVGEIAGHTDNLGKPESNLALSQGRAEAVRNYLISRGVRPEQLTAKGYGQTRPITNNDNVLARQANRRIEFVPK